jgi:Ion channel
MSDGKEDSLDTPGKEMTKDEAIKMQVKQNIQLEREILNFIRNGKHKAKDCFNPKRVELLDLVRQGCEFFLMALSLYCVAVSLYSIIYKNESILLYITLAYSSVIIAIFNVAAVIIQDQIDKEYGLSPMITKKLTTDFWSEFRNNLFHTILILIFPNPLFRKIPPIKNKEAALYIEWDMMAHIVQINKLYFVFRYFLGASKYYSDSAYRVCSMYNSLRNWIFVVKCKIRDDPIRILFIVLVSNVFTFSYMLYVAESVTPELFGVNRNFTDFKTCVWCICITLTTVGYGDVTPLFKLGKVIIFLSCIFGLVTSSLFITNVASLLNLPNNQKIAYGLIAKLELGKAVEYRLHNIMRYMGKLYRFKTGHKGARLELTKSVTRNENQLEDVLSDFMNAKQEYDTFEQPMNEKEMDRNFEIITKELKEIKILISAVVSKTQSLGIICKKVQEQPIIRSTSPNFSRSPTRKKGLSNMNFTDSVMTRGSISSGRNTNISTKLVEKKSRGQQQDNQPMWMKEQQDDIEQF